MSVVRVEDWSEDAPRFERIHKPSGPRPHDRRSLGRELHPTAGMMKGCVGKHSYSRSAAKVVARGAADASGLDIGPYRCRYCHRYHIGRSPRRLTNWKMDA